LRRLRVVVDTVVVTSEPSVSVVSMVMAEATAGG